jgi:hypothetical protein
MLGPGKYDFLCSLVREVSGAEVGAVVIVLGGQLGTGFSMQLVPGAERMLADVLRSVASEIERDLGPMPVASPESS